ncbi:MAG: hypothetical protein ISP86_03925 [Shewanellaceae bacterium]|nr:hypothetical protein [Shewanellaceae bacterium]
MADEPKKPNKNKDAEAGAAKKSLLKLKKTIAQKEKEDDREKKMVTKELKEELKKNQGAQDDSGTRKSIHQLKKELLKQADEQQKGRVKTRRLLKEQLKKKK